MTSVPLCMTSVPPVNQPPVDLTGCFPDNDKREPVIWCSIMTLTGLGSKLSYRVKMVFPAVLIFFVAPALIFVMAKVTKELTSSVFYVCIGPHRYHWREHR